MMHIPSKKTSRLAQRSVVWRTGDKETIISPSKVSVSSYGRLGVSRYDV
jgi:hypothetical protein